MRSATRRAQCGQVRLGRRGTRWSAFRSGLPLAAAMASLITAIASISLVGSAPNLNTVFRTIRSVPTPMKSTFFSKMIVFLLSLSLSLSHFYSRVHLPFCRPPTHRLPPVCQAVCHTPQSACGARASYLRGRWCRRARTCWPRSTSTCSRTFRITCPASEASCK